MPQLKLERFRDTTLRDYTGRFAFGGAAAVVAELIARGGGPSVGGLFLAFPAILPAALSLVKKREGKRAAGEEAEGAILGCAGLFAFAIVVEYTSDRVRSALVLGLAVVAWLFASVSAWQVLERVRRRES